MNNKILSFQRRLFHRLRKSPNTKSHFVAQLSEILNLNKSAVYNRINGKTALSLDEVLRLQEVFGADIIGELSAGSNQVQIQFPSLNELPISFNQFFHSLLNEMQQHTISPNQLNVLYIANELPLFHFFTFPKLACFKMFIWARTIWNWDNYQNITFKINNDSLFKKNNSLIDELMTVYYSASIYEFWSINILANTLSQIDYYRSLQIIESDQDADLLRSELLDLVEFFEKKSRNFDNNFNLYVNEYTFSNNIILTKYQDTPTKVFFTYDNPNFMSSTDEQLLNYTADWVNRIRRRCVQIGTQNESKHILFFRKLREEIQDSMVTIS